MAREFDRDSDRTSVAREFDGTDDTIDLGTVADSDQSLTIMTWVKPDTVSTTVRRFVTKSSGGAFQDGGMYLDKLSGGRPRFLITVNQSAFTATAPTTISANAYTHIAGRYDFQNGTSAIFVNGQPVGNASPGQAPTLKTQPWRLGADDPAQGENFFDGTLDDTRIYTAALSDAEIRQIYRQTRPEQPVAPVASESLVAWYPFRRNSALDHTSLVDIPVADRTAYDATVNGATYKPSGGTTDIKTGANSGAFEFDGVDDFMGGISPDFPNALTVMCFFNGSGAGSGGGFFQCAGLVNSEESGPSEGDYGIGIFDDGSLCVGVSPEGGSGASIVSSSAGFDDGSYHHLALTWSNGGSVAMYIDGSLENSKSVSSGGLNENVNIGRTPNLNVHYTGLIDGVRLYNAELTQSEINQIYLNTKA